MCSLLKSVRGRRSERCVRVAAHSTGHASTVARGQSEKMSVSQFLSTLKLDTSSGLCSAVAQHVDTGELLMAAFATPAAVEKTLATGRATFFSRSRSELWTKGDTSGNTIDVVSVHYDCDRDCIVYLSVPRGPACHTGAKTCFYSEVRPHFSGNEDTVELVEGSFPRATLFQLQDTIAGRKEAIGADAGGKPSWTAKLLQDPQLLCSKVREEADELCRALEDAEGKERVASEMADLLYHSMVLLGRQDVPIEDVMGVLRKRFGVSGIEEKMGRGQVSSK